MRRTAGTLIALLLLALPAAASADVRPLSDGGMGFGTITSPADPEEYSYEVTLGEDQVLRAIDDRHVGVFELGEPAFTIAAEDAHDAQGAAVPTTLAISGPKVITLTVHHRAGNPAAGYARFTYPIIGGTGWEGGFHTIIVPMENPLGSPPTNSAPPSPVPPPAATSADKPQRHLVTNALGSEKLVYKPRAFLLSADGSFGVQRVTWQHYDGAVAKATGRAYVNDCEPSCAAGHITHPPAELTLANVVYCQGKPIYVRLRYKLSGPLPQGFPRRGGYSMRPLGEDGKPVC